MHTHLALMRLSFFACHTFEFLHVSCGHRHSIDCQRINLSCLTSTHIVFDEDVKVTHVLELDETKLHHVFTGQVFSSQSKKNLEEKELNFIHTTMANQVITN